MMTEQLVWMVFFLPLISFCIIGLIIRPFFNKYSILSAFIAIIFITSALIISLSIFISVMINGNYIELGLLNWVTIGDLNFTIGILMDPLTATMLVVVTGISLMVQIYSIGYMKAKVIIDKSQGSTFNVPIELGQPVYARYFAYMSLFTASMTGLILSANIVQLFVFWELVGLCSYLLIGFWFHKPAAIAAAKKAFIVTRIGDFGFLLALIYLFSHSHLFPPNVNPLEIEVINKYLPELVNMGIIGSSTVTLIALGIFFGAMGKSGQFPLHTWLPDAMEGPTPVSALIHAATMVAAGVFLVARFFPLFQSSTSAMAVVALIGAITAFFAATMGLVSNDIKRVLAYSTVSQLGYMMLALGVGAYGIAIFHHFTHAFFKALLFLGSGSVNHATGTFDMRYMGGLRKKMPITYAAFLLGSLSLAGIFPLSGFWSKDEILLSVFNHGFHDGHLLSIITFTVAITAVFMTAFYMFRALFMTFEGTFKGGSSNDPEASSHNPVHLTESPKLMTLPMAILAILAVSIGFIANPPFKILGINKHWLVETLQHNISETHSEFNLSLAIISSLIAIAGILLATLMYTKILARTGNISLINPNIFSKNFRPVYILLSKKYYFDELYETIIAKNLFYKSIAKFLDAFDQLVVDKIANSIGWVGKNSGVLLKELHNGQMQMYASITSIGILLITFILVFGKYGFGA